jgi:hypothetical protein
MAVSRTDGPPSAARRVALGVLNFDDDSRFPGRTRSRRGRERGPDPVAIGLRSDPPVEVIRVDAAVEDALLSGEVSPRYVREQRAERAAQRVVRVGGISERPLGGGLRERRAVRRNYENDER